MNEKIEKWRWKIGWRILLLLAVFFLAIMVRIKG